MAEGWVLLCHVKMIFGAFLTVQSGQNSYDFFQKLLTFFHLRFLEQEELHKYKLSAVYVACLELTGHKGIFIIFWNGRTAYFLYQCAETMLRGCAHILWPNLNPFFS